MVVQGCPELVYAVWHDAVWLSAEFEFIGKNNRVARNEQVSHADFFFTLERVRSEVDRQISYLFPKRESIRIASCRPSIKTAIRWGTQNRVKPIVSQWGKDNRELAKPVRQADDVRSARAGIGKPPEVVG